MERPKSWRTGQTIFNFLEWLRTEKNIPENQNFRMADPFGLSDQVWDAYYKEFLEKYGRG